MTSRDASSPIAGSAPKRADKRLEKLGLACLILSSLQVAFSSQKVLALFLKGPALDLQRRLLTPKASWAMGPGATPHMGDLMDAATEMTNKVTTWEAIRALPFLVASGALVWIGLRVYRGDVGALHAARAWAFWALGVVAISTLIQALVVVPATLDYARRVGDMIPSPRAGARPPPFDPQRFIETVTAAATIVSVVIGAIVFSAWPIVLRVWAGKILRELAAPADGEPDA